MNYYTQQTIAVWIILMGIILYCISADSEGASHTHEIEVSCCSYHFDREANYNEFNYGVFYRRWFNSNQSVHVGAYRNSYNDTSVVVGAGYEWALGRDFSFTLQYGVVTGYERSPVLPYVLPTFSYKGIVHLHTFPIDDGGFALSFTILRY